MANIGYDGSVSLTADRATVDANDPSATLTATLSKPLPSPYFLTIYDDLGNRVAYCNSSDAPTTCTGSGQPAIGAARTYTAYVAQDVPASGPPQVDVSATSSVSVTNVGYDGTVSLTADRTTVNANDPSATLTATLSEPLPSPYFLTIYDDLGNRVASCYPYGGPTTCTGSGQPATGTSRTYTAYVSQDIPYTGPPTVDVRAASSLAVTNVGYDGTVTLTADRTSVDANDPSATLTATLSEPLPSPYFLSIFDDLGNRVAYCNSSGGPTTCVGGGQPAIGATRTYTAYVSQDLPYTGAPAVDVRATSSLAVTNVGYTGTVSLTADRTSVDADDPSASLTATLSKPLPSPYFLSIYDDTGARLTYCGYFSGSPTTCTVGVQPGTSSTRTYSAYVALDFPDTGPPTSGVRATSSLPITNLGYTGTLTLTADHNQVDASNPTASLTATLSKPLPAPYVLSIYNTLGDRITWCSSGGGPTTCSASTGTIAASTTATYYAFVSQDFPDSSIPSVDVRAADSTTVTNTDATPYAESVVALGAGVVAQDVCFGLNSVRSPDDPGSISAAYLACIAFITAGAITLTEALDWVLTNYGQRGLLIVYGWIYGQTHDIDGNVVQVPQFDPASPPDTRTAPFPQNTINFPASVLDQITAEIEAHASSPNMVADPTLARQLASACLNLTSWAFSTGVTFEDPNADPCGQDPIFAPGTQAGGAAENDMLAIEGNPSLMRLNKMSRSVKRNTNVSPSWKNTDQICVQARSEGNPCDEYPFYSTEQGGPGARLASVPDGENSSEGGSLAAFYGNACGLKSATVNSNTHDPNADGDHYLVVPVYWLGLPTMFTCGTRRGH